MPIVICTARVLYSFNPMKWQESRMSIQQRSSKYAQDPSVYLGRIRQMIDRQKVLPSAPSTITMSLFCPPIGRIVHQPESTAYEGMAKLKITE
ncbi:hypothetical protein CY34DRAFT_642889 [Suillus luteus UH-Slu-Lm8-n1]|uniref:Uncharacterized protein n=1 Tax=Suillus luteus UH-Slu-Lm8-n1 TaxID=930992 RepID=A0A0C9ZXD7_9AGAM|nr:hypothetical protein CY34DRAFT_661804 [Suillus luteus UH-Slu-Lm8-n1]KIK34456.1 hypothetical protein CY34DRAFT_642889 [Suillus luteus UH-Slu-Lm8-n1]